MEFLIIIIIIGALIFFFSKGKQKEELDYEITINGKPIGSSHDDDYEDSWESEEEKSNDKIYDTEYPLFFALQNRKELFDYISSELHELAKVLSSQKSDNVKSAVSQMLPQDSYKKMKGLPQYLQVVPIKTLLSNGIFVNPTDSDLPELLNSMTMDILKGYCSEFEIKPARSKKDTIEKLLDSPIKEKLEYDQYFRLNPSVKKINKQFGTYCQIINSKQLDNSKISAKRISKPLDPDELNDKQEKGGFSIQDYGYSSIVYSKNNKPLFRILGVTTSKWNDYAFLLSNGNILISENCRIDDWVTMRVSIMDENQKILGQFKIKDFNNYEISEIEDSPIVFLNLFENNYWTLNYETLEEKHIENPDNLDIYSLVGG